MARRRRWVEGGDPLTYEKIEAYGRTTGHKLSPWTVDVLMRMDDAILAVLRKTAPKAAPSDQSDGVPASDGKSMKGLFRGLMARQQALKAKPETRT